MTRREAGFTLLELLVALAVLGLLLVLVTQGVQFGLQTTAAEALMRDRHADLEVADRTLRRVISQADPGIYPEPATLRGTESVLSLVTRLPSSAADAPADVTLGVEQGRLVMRWAARLHAEALGPAPAAQGVAIVDQVARAEFAYSAGEGWASSWRAETLPRLVRISVVFTAGSQRRWPPIVVAPLREPIEQ